VRRARFPLLKTLEQFEWNWPKKINRPQIQNLFRLAFVQEKANVIFLGTCGVGKSHLGIALAHTACVLGHSVLFTIAIDMVNTLSAARGTGALKRAMNRYLRPAIVLIDELGFLPVDKTGADLLFQIISGRYERGSYHRDLKSGLQKVARDIQQRRYPDLRAVGSFATSCGDSHHRRPFLPRQGPGATLGLSVRVCPRALRHRSPGAGWELRVAGQL
jgi:hypothetical protein